MNFHKASWNFKKLMNFFDFMKFSDFLKFLFPFLRPSENSNETNAFLMILEPIFRKIYLFRKNGEIPGNSTHFAKFHPFSWNFMIFTKFCCFGSSEGSFCDLSSAAHAFKAQNVRFRDIFHVLSKKLLFGPRTWFSPKFLFRGEKSPMGLQKRSQNVTFINGFATGARLGSKTWKWAEFHALGPKRGSLPPERVNVRFWLSIS